MHLTARWSPEAIRRGPDSNVGAQVTQLTSAALISHDIYCEERYTSADGRFVAILRSPTGYAPGEMLWIADLETNQVAPTGCTLAGYPTSNPFSDALFFEAVGAASPRVLMRFDFATWELDEVCDLAPCPDTRYPVCSVSPDERTFVGNYRIEGDLWGLYRVGLQAGAWEHFHEHEHICNPHPQYEPREGRDILIQLNRGSVLDEEQNIISLVGEEGATLYVLGADDGAVRYLPVGSPYTGHITGHEGWLGGTGEIVLTTSEPPGGAIYLTKPCDQAARRLWRGRCFGHMSGSVDGKFFVTDDFINGRIYVGSIATRRMMPLCDTKATCASPQATHPHPYMTPGNRHVIFNSDSTGLAQVWAVEVPAWFLEVLEDRA